MRVFCHDVDVFALSVLFRFVSLNMFADAEKLEF